MTARSRKRRAERGKSQNFATMAMLPNTYRPRKKKKEQVNSSVLCILSTSASFWRDIRAVTRDFAFGLSRASYCKQREAKRTNSVPSSFVKWPSKQESINIGKFLPRMRSSACNKAIRKKAFQNHTISEVISLQVQVTRTKGVGHTPSQSLPTNSKLTLWRKNIGVGKRIIS